MKENLKTVLDLPKMSLFLFMKQEIPGWGARHIPGAPELRGYSNFLFVQVETMNRETQHESYIWSF